MNITTAIESEFEEVKWKAKRMGWDVAENSMIIYVVSEQLKTKLEEEMIDFKYNFTIEIDPTIEETEDNGIFKSNIYIEPIGKMERLNYWKRWR